VFWHTRRRWIRALAVVVTVAVPVIVGLARMYRGMHFFTDVVAGVLLGAASVLVVIWIVCRAEDRRRGRDAAHDPGPIDRNTRVAERVDA
jgi:undecaprenyl-diphosphatase